MTSFMLIASSGGLKSCRRAPKFHTGLLGDSTAARHPVHLRISSAKKGGTSLCAPGIFSLQARNVSLRARFQLHGWSHTANVGAMQQYATMMGSFRIKEGLFMQKCLFRCMTVITFIIRIGHETLYYWCDSNESTSPKGCKKPPSPTLPHPNPLRPNYKPEASIWRVTPPTTAPPNNTKRLKVSLLPVCKVSRPCGGVQREFCSGVQGESLAAKNQPRVPVSRQTGNVIASLC